MQQNQLNKLARIKNSSISDALSPRERRRIRREIRKAKKEYKEKQAILSTLNEQIRRLSIKITRQNQKVIRLEQEKREYINSHQ